MAQRYRSALHADTYTLPSPLALVHITSSVTLPACFPLVETQVLPLASIGTIRGTMSSTNRRCLEPRLALQKRRNSTLLSSNLPAYQPLLAADATICMPRGHLCTIDRPPSRTRPNEGTIDKEMCELERAIAHRKSELAFWNAHDRRTMRLGQLHDEDLNEREPHHVTVLSD